MNVPSANEESIPKASPGHVMKVRRNQSARQRKKVTASVSPAFS